jgi:uncharacterized membrane protein
MMAINKKLLNVAIATVVTVGMSMMAGEAQANVQKMEHCYGIAKAGKNDCGTKAHSCAGQSKISNDSHEWILVEKGTCTQLGGSLMPGGKPYSRHAKASSTN